MRNLRLKMTWIFLLFAAISWTSKIEEISLATAISPSTLFSQCAWLDCNHFDIYKAVLRLPDLNDLTELSHFNAFYHKAESPEKPASELITELIAEADNSDGYLEVRYSIDKQDFIQIEYGGRVGGEPFCASVFRENVTVQFHNGLTLLSSERALHEVPMELCEFL